MNNTAPDEQRLLDIVAPPLDEATNHEYLEQTLRDYAASQGRFLVHTQDSNFLSCLRTTLASIGVDTNVLTMIRQQGDILAQIKIKGMSGNPLLLIVDYDFIRKNLGTLVAKIKKAFRSLKIIILTNKAHVFELAFLHEAGADNFILTPVSSSSLVARIALTLRPHGAIGKLLNESRRLIAHGEAQDALDLTAKILHRTPDSSAAYMLLGDAHLARGKRDEALAAFEMASEHAKLCLEPLKKLAQFHASDGNHDKHLEYLERLNELSPLNMERKVHLGRLYLKTGRQDDAKEVFNKAVEYVTNEAPHRIAELTIQIADACQAQAPDMAEAFYRQAMGIRSFDLRADIDIFNRLGSSLRKQGKWAEAVTEYERALELSPANENLHYNKALAHSEGRQDEEAFLCLSNIMKLNQNFHTTSAMLAFNCALISKNAGRKDCAVAFAQSALDQDPANTKAADLLAQFQPHTAP